VRRHRGDQPIGLGLAEELHLVAGSGGQGGVLAGVGGDEPLGHGVPEHDVELPVDVEHRLGGERLGVADVGAAGEQVSHEPLDRQGVDAAQLQAAEHGADVPADDPLGAHPGGRLEAGRVGRPPHVQPVAQGHVTTARDQRLAPQRVRLQLHLDRLGGGLGGEPGGDGDLLPADQVPDAERRPVALDPH